MKLEVKLGLGSRISWVRIIKLFCFLGSFKVNRGDFDDELVKDY